ncbi:PH domain-containing protein [Mesobacillus campisalis]
MKMMSEAKRLHPVAALIHALRQLKELLIPLLLFVVFGSRGSGSLFYLAASAGTLIIVIGFGILTWYRFTYRIENRELRIEHGIFIRRKRYIPFERIQSLDISEGLLQRPLGLVKIKVETAGGAGSEDAEAVLAAVTKEDAAFIHEMLVSVKKGRLSASEEAEAEAETILYRITLRELLLLASTSGGVGVVISAVFAFVFQFEEFIPYETVFKGLEDFASLGLIIITGVIFLGFLLVWVISVLSTMLKYANFTLKKVENDFIITRGLLEKRQFTIPLNRIQAVRISENPLRQPFGLASVFLESAGGSAVNEESAKVIVLPIIKKGRVPKLLGPYLKECEFEWSLAPAPKRAFRRYLFRSSIMTLPLAVFFVIFFRPWSWIGLLLLAASFLWAWLEFRAAGWGLHGGYLALRFRTIGKNTVIMKKEKVQSISVKQSHFQRKKQLATIEVVVKSGHSGSGGKVADLECGDMERIFRWYSREQGSPANVELAGRE